MMIQDLPLMARHFAAAHWRWRTLDSSALARYQEQRAQRMVAYVAHHSPFYREHWAGHDPRDWRTLPPVDKQLMMQHFDRFNTRGITREQAMHVALAAEQSRDFRPVLAGVTVGLSSGTSGHRGLFLVSRAEQAGWAGTMLARALHDWRPRRLRVAFFLRSNSNLYEQIGGLLLQFRYFDLMSPLTHAIAQLNDFVPDIIVGPPSLLAMLAEAHKKGTLCVQPERLIAVAEVLESHDRAQLEATFAAPVQQIYQCTEGLLAVSCRQGALHIQEDLVVLQCEPLTADGVEGHVTPVVTDLWRTTQPIIRYCLNDVLHLAPFSCTCGSAFRVIQSIEGRCDDICYFAQRAGGLRPFFPDTLRRMVLLADVQIIDYQVIQEQIGQVRIRLALADDATWSMVEAEVRRSVEQELARYDCYASAIVIEQGIITPAVGSKRRRVQRMVSL